MVESGYVGTPSVSAELLGLALPTLENVNVNVNLDVNVNVTKRDHNNNKVPSTRRAPPNQAAQRQRRRRNDESEERSVRRGEPIRAAYSGVGKRRFQRRDRGKNGPIVT